MISAKKLAAQAVEKVRTPAIPYAIGGRSDKGTDCINLVGWCVQELGGRPADIPKGSNTAWRTIMQSTWTLADAQRLGKLVPGALVYIKDAATPQWPDGDYGHVGVYVGRQNALATDQVIVHASASRGGVYASTIRNAWTHVAWLKCVDYGQGADAGADADSDAPPCGKDDKKTKAVKVTTEGGALNIRKEPSIAAARVGSVPNGTLLDVLDWSPQWARISHNGINGWISGEYLTAPQSGFDTQSIDFGGGGG